MRRTHLRGHRYILKRLLIHAGAGKLALLMRCLHRAGTPRGMAGLAALVELAAEGVRGRLRAVMERLAHLTQAIRFASPIHTRLA